jgi:radical SAM protein with 4Fe4S-binding SPASM domain
MTDKSMSKTYPDRPSKVNVEVTNVCNLGCVMCSQTTGTFSRSFMNIRLFRSIVDQLRDLMVPEVRYHWRGEVFAHPQWEDILRYPHDAGIPRPVLFTNGVLLDAYRRSVIMSSGVSEVHFSLDGLSGETNKSIRRGIDYDKVVSNIFSFISERNATKTQLKTAIHFTLLPANQHEALAFVARWRELVDEVFVADAWGASRGSLSVLTLWPNEDIRRNRPHDMCRFIQQRLFISSEGEVFPCPVMHSGQRDPLGDARTTAISDIWRGRDLEILRRSHERADAKRMAPCNTCDLNGSHLFGTELGLVVR